MNGDLPPGVLAAAEQVDGGPRESRRSAGQLGQVDVQREAPLTGPGAGERQRCRQDRIGAQAAFVGGAVQCDQRLVEAGLAFK